MERTNVHHCWWERRRYKTSLEKRFRTHDAFVIPMLVSVHADLHHDMMPPPKPGRDLMLGILNNLEDYERPLEGVFATVEYLREQETRGADRLANHLTRQIGYLLVGVEYDNQLR